MDWLAYQVTGIANGNKDVALSAGFELRQDPKTISSVAMPTNLETKNLDTFGEFEAKWDCDIAGVISYAVEYQYEGETAWLPGTICTSKKVVISGVKPRSFILVRVHSMGRKELVSENTTPSGVLVS